MPNYSCRALFNTQIKVAGKISPNTVDMIRWITSGISLSVHEFDQEFFPTDTVVVTNPRFPRSCPSKMNSFPSRLPYHFASFFSNWLRNCTDIDIDQSFECRLLSQSKIRKCDPQGRPQQPAPHPRIEFQRVPLQRSELFSTARLTGHSQIGRPLPPHHATHVSLYPRGR